MSAPLRPARLTAVAVVSLLLAAGVSDLAVAQNADAGVAAVRPQSAPLVIGHRGASGYRPEHTLAAYELAARMGADFIEPDLVITSDGVLVARHENEISGTTDVANHPEFAARRTTKTIDGQPLTGWFVEDFTLAELRTLRAKERIPAIRQRNTIYDGLFLVPTLQEVIDLAQRLSLELGRPIGIYPETKHPTFFQSIGRPLEPPLIAILRRNGLDRADAAVFVQSFETTNLRELNRVLDVPLVQLLGSKTSKPFDLASGTRTYADLATPSGLREIARYADGVGPSKDYVVPRDATGRSLAPTSFVTDAHTAGLVVHPYTFRNENTFLPLELRSSADPAAYGNALAEYALFFGLGVDGLFSDNPDTAVLARGGPRPQEPPRPGQGGAGGTGGSPATATATNTTTVNNDNTVTVTNEGSRSSSRSGSGSRERRLRLIVGRTFRADSVQRYGLRVLFEARGVRQVRLALSTRNGVVATRSAPATRGREGIVLSVPRRALRVGTKLVLRLSAAGGRPAAVTRTLTAR